MYSLIAESVCPSMGQHALYVFMKLICFTDGNRPAWGALSQRLSRGGYIRSSRLHCLLRTLQCQIWYSCKCFKIYHYVSCLWLGICEGLPCPCHTQSLRMKMCELMVFVCSWIQDPLHLSFYNTENEKWQFMVHAWYTTIEGSSLQWAQCTYNFFVHG